ncbi:hypothetical protein F7Q99_25395 [Streptomyces kaniharaensis]|uniref:NAD-dependent epimerase/dehydratase domain-containing protein n=1 Tax=Streptomyces kaniharaensis TaxID=212423 RepID=A0A6N7KZV7_9ACTN|nr:hypothetical protein [Streptomyces kaniharaensis]
MFVAGGSGVLGRRLVAQLVARGHHVTATTRPAGPRTAEHPEGRRPFRRGGTSRRRGGRSRACRRRWRRGRWPAWNGWHPG